MCINTQRVPKLAYELHYGRYVVTSWKRQLHKELLLLWEAISTRQRPRDSVEWETKQLIERVGDGLASTEGQLQ